MNKLFVVEERDTKTFSHSGRILKLQTLGLYFEGSFYLKSGSKTTKNYVRSVFIRDMEIARPNVNG